MSRLLRLYPRAWRERYGEEMLALLESQPSTLIDHLDLIRGALDAHLHPQVRGQATPGQEHHVNHRLLGVMAAIGGLAWLVGFASIFVMPRDAYGDPDATIAILAATLGIAFVGTALGELGTRSDMATSRRMGHVITTACLIAAALMFVPWPGFVIGLYAFLVIGALAAVRGSVNGAFPRWFAPAFAVAAVASLAGFLGGVSQPVAVVFMASIGLAGLILAWIALRGRDAATVASDIAPA